MTITGGRLIRAMLDDEDGHSESTNALHFCVEGDLRMNEQVKAMWADPRFKLLADLDRLLDSNKIWGGQEWVYHPIQPAKYRPMAERIRSELRNLYTEYGVKE